MVYFVAEWVNKFLTEYSFSNAGITEKEWNKECVCDSSQSIKMLEKKCDILPSFVYFPIDT